MVCNQIKTFKDIKFCNSFSRILLELILLPFCLDVRSKAPFKSSNCIPCVLSNKEENKLLFLSSCYSEIHRGENLIFLFYSSNSFIIT